MLISTKKTTSYVDEDGEKILWIFLFCGNYTLLVLLVRGGVKDKSIIILYFPDYVDDKEF